MFLTFLQNETAVLHDRVYQAHGSSSSPRPKFPFAAVGVKGSRTPEPTAPSQPNQGAATTTSSITTSTNMVTSTQQPNTTTANPYHMQGVGGGTNTIGGYPPQPVPQPNFGHGGGYAPPITQPLVSHGTAIMQPSTETYTRLLCPVLCSLAYPGLGEGVCRHLGVSSQGGRPPTLSMLLWRGMILLL